MTAYLVVPILFAIAVLQTTLVPGFRVWGVYPNLPLIVVASWSLLHGVREGVVWGFVAGVALDLLSGAPFGAATLSLMAVGALSGLGQVTVFRTHLVLPLVVTFLTSIVFGLTFLAILQISGHTVAWGDSLVHSLLPAAVLNVALVPVVYWLMRILNYRIGQEEMEW